MARRVNGLRVYPAPSLKVANEIVEMLHRHHRPLHTHKFSLLAVKDGVYVGALIAQRPAAINTDQVHVIEVARLATNGTRNACSLLYGAAARTAKAMGYSQIQTYILASETGASLRASGWKHVRDTKAVDWHRPNIGRNRKTLPHMSVDKSLYRLDLHPFPSDPDFELPWDDCLL